MSQQPEKSVAQVLRDAASIVEKGWCQHHYSLSANGGPAPIFDGDLHCMRGAIIVACVVARMEPSASMYALAAVMPEGWETGIGWNDAPERTQAEVIAKLLEAAELAEQEAIHV